MSFFLIRGFILWLLGTAATRLFGQTFLLPSKPVSVFVLFLVSFPLMAWIARRMCRDRNLSAVEWPRAALWLCLPSLLLDAFATTFFAHAYPNLPAGSAGLFGGWILWCCAGALTGAVVRK